MLICCGIQCAVLEHQSLLITFYLLFLFFFFINIECCFRPDTDKMSSRGGKKKSTKTSRSAKAGVIFPVGRMLRYIKKGHPKYRIGVGAPVYMAAVLEYLTGRFC